MLRAGRPAAFDALSTCGSAAARPPLPGPAAAAAGAPTAARARRPARRAERGPGRDDDDEALRTAASDAECCATATSPQLTGDERDEVHRLIALLAPRVGTRRTLRRSPAARIGSTCAAPSGSCCATAASPARCATPAAREKPRRLVLLLDVSGSMAPYADALLRFAHAAVRAAPVDHRGLHDRHPADPGHPAAAAARSRPRADRGRHGDPRLERRHPARRRAARLPRPVGPARHGPPRRRRRSSRDGWERGDAALLGEQMARLARLAHRVVWVNPHKGKDGFAPATGGMVAALPHLDELIAGHSLDALRNSWR